MVKAALLIIFSWFLLGSTFYGTEINSRTKSNDGFYDWSFDRFNMDMDSPANFGVYTVDATDRGKVRRDGVNFEFSDDTQVKWWGVNLCFAANIPSSVSSNWIPNYLSFFGINIVRIHHADNTSAFIAEGDTSQELDAAALDNFDYLVSKLKEKGIYVDLNLNVSREFLEGDGVPDVEAAKDANSKLKGATAFEPTLIQLQKDYATDLLTHVNPYTNYAYKDERAVALIEVTNENSLYHDWRDGDFDYFKYDHTTSLVYPDSYIVELTSQWNSWLSSEYTTPANLIATKSLSGADSTQTEILNHTTSGSLVVYPPASASKTFSDGTAVITIGNGGDKIYSIMYNKYYTQESDKVYQFTFTISADSNCVVRVTSQLNSSPWTLYAYKYVSVTTSPQTFDFFFPGEADVDDTRIGFYLGTLTGRTITIGDYSLKKADDYDFIEDDSDLDTFDFHRPPYTLDKGYPTTTQYEDVKTFIHDTQKSFFNTMRDHLLNTIGATVPINMSGGAHFPGYYIQADIRAYSDWISVHSYHDHPTFPGTPWDTNNFLIENDRVIPDVDNSFLNAAYWGKEGTKTMPYVLGEFNDSYPNDYAYEGYLLTPMYGRTWEWNGVFQFALQHGDYYETSSYISNYFDAIKNPQNMLCLGLGALMFQTATNVSYTNDGDVVVYTADQIAGVVGGIAGNTYTLGGITFTPNKNGAVFFYSTSNESLADSDKIVCVILGKVRSYNSGWYDDTIVAGKFTWGNSPTQLEFIPVTFSMAYTAGMAVNQLDDKGTLSTAINVINNDGTAEFTNNGIMAPWFLIDK